ncbi:MAG: hypothetical protein P8L44_23175 [Opitutales bacterium]|jgi:hypothetical protein|nr:hypothetical protein [Opitutales bacterium]
MGINDPKKSLVVFTTCERPHLLTKNLTSIQDALEGLVGFDLVVSIDGLSTHSNQESLSLANDLGVDCIVADQPEGVGISKNRVLSLLPEYGFYFFIEDDVEVLHSDLFLKHIEAFETTDIHHFCLHEPERLLREQDPTESQSGGVIRHALYGSAQVTFFTREALDAVGGWHPIFQELRRGGHTEHSYRIYNEGLNPAPFNYIDALQHSCKWNNPTSIIIPDDKSVGDNDLFKVEIDLIESELGKQPFYTKYRGRLLPALSPYKQELIRV